MIPRTASTMGQVQKAGKIGSLFRRRYESLFHFANSFGALESFSKIGDLAVCVHYISLKSKSR